MIPQKRKNNFGVVKVSGTKEPTEKGKILKTRELNSKRDPMLKEIKASLKVGVQLGKLDPMVMVILMEMGNQIKVGNHQEKGKDHQMGLEK